MSNCLRNKHDIASRDGVPEVSEASKVLFVLLMAVALTLPSGEVYADDTTRNEVGIVLDANGDPVGVSPIESGFNDAGHRVDTVPDFSGTITSVESLGDTDGDGWGDYVATTEDGGGNVVKVHYETQPKDHQGTLNTGRTHERGPARVVTCFTLAAAAVFAFVNGLGSRGGGGLNSGRNKRDEEE